MHKKRYLDWKQKCGNRIPGISEENSDIILKYVCDMEFGLNVSNKSKKGARGYAHLYALQQRMTLLTRRFEKFYNVIDLTQID